MIKILKRNDNDLSIQKISDFWLWFQDHETKITDRLSNKDNVPEVILEIDFNLKPLFPLFLGELEFEIGINKSNWEFTFFHCGKKYLKKVARKVESLMPEDLKGKWTFIIEK